MLFIIMEDTTDETTDRSLDEKFARILEHDAPAFFFAIFHKGARMDGVLHLSLVGCAAYIQLQKCQNV
jgi:hypothetical protein